MDFNFSTGSLQSMKFVYKLTWRLLPVFFTDQLSHEGTDSSRTGRIHMLRQKFAGCTSRNTGCSVSVCLEIPIDLSSHMAKAVGN